MKLRGDNNGRAVVMVAFRGQHFQGYAIKTLNGWTCVAAIGLSWAKIPCRTAEDARITLRTTSHAARFEAYDELEDLNDVIATLPPFQQPGILPDQISGVPARLPKLRT